MRRPADPIACPFPDCEDGEVYVSPDDDRALLSGVGIGEALWVPCPACARRHSAAPTSALQGLGIVALYVAGGFAVRAVLRVLQ